MRIKRARCKKYEQLESQILDILKDFNFVSIHFLEVKLKEKGINANWKTVKSYLEALESKGKIKKYSRKSTNYDSTLWLLK